MILNIFIIIYIDFCIYLFLHMQYMLLPPGWRYPPKSEIMQNFRIGRAAAGRVQACPWTYRPVSRNLAPTIICSPRMWFSTRSSFCRAMSWNWSCCSTVNSRS